MTRYHKRQSFSITRNNSKTVKTCVQNSSFQVGELMIQQNTLIKTKSSSSTSSSGISSSSPKFKPLVAIDRTYIIKHTEAKYKEFNVKDSLNLKITQQMSSTEISAQKYSFLKRQKAKSSLNNKKESCVKLKKSWTNDKNILSSTRVEFDCVKRRASEVFGHRLNEDYIHNGKRVKVDVVSNELMRQVNKKRRTSLIDNQAESTTCYAKLKRKRVLPSLNLSKITLNKKLNVRSCLTTSTTNPTSLSSSNQALVNSIINDGHSRFNNLGDLLVWYV